MFSRINKAFYQKRHNNIMVPFYRFSLQLGLVFCIIIQTSAAAVTGTTCAPGHKDNGDKACQAVDPNAVCPAGTTNCACKAGYKVKPKDDSSCLQVITTVVCTPGTGGDTTCHAVDTNSECPTGANKCACKTGYTGTDVCSKVITTVVCNPSTGGDATCQAVDTNSECPAGANTCACKTGYTGTDICSKVITTVACTPGTGGDATCQAVDTNSECPTGANKCACKTGYTGTDICSKDSSADCVQTTTTLVALFAVVVMIVRLLF